MLSDVCGIDIGAKATAFVRILDDELRDAIIIKAPRAASANDPRIAYRDAVERVIDSMTVTPPQVFAIEEPMAPAYQSVQAIKTLIVRRTMVEEELSRVFTPWCFAAVLPRQWHGFMRSEATMRNIEFPTKATRRRRKDGGVVVQCDVKTLASMTFQGVVGRSIETHVTIDGRALARVHGEPSQDVIDAYWVARYAAATWSIKAKAQEA